MQKGQAVYLVWLNGSGYFGYAVCFGFDRGKEAEAAAKRKFKSYYCHFVGAITPKEANGITFAKGKRTTYEVLYYRLDKLGGE